MKMLRLTLALLGLVMGVALFQPSQAQAAWCSDLESACNNYWTCDGDFEITSCNNDGSYTYVCQCHGWFGGDTLRESNNCLPDDPCRDTWDLNCGKGEDLL
jgi:hypothetical protein